MGRFRALGRWLVRHWGFPGNVQFWVQATQWLWRNVVGPLLPSGLLGYLSYHWGYLSPLAAVVFLFALYVLTLALGGRLAEAVRGRLATPSPPSVAASQPINENLRQRCRELSVELFEFYRREQKDLNKRLRWTNLAEEPDRSQIRRGHTTDHNIQTMDRYGEQLGSDVFALSRDLAQGGWITPQDRDRFENPEKPKDIQDIALRLRAICRED